MFCTLGTIVGQVRGGGEGRQIKLYRPEDALLQVADEPVRGKVHVLGLPGPQERGRQGGHEGVGPAHLLGGGGGGKGGHDDSQLVGLVCLCDCLPVGLTRSPRAVTRPASEVARGHLS